MKWECVLMDERREGRAEGLAEGLAEGKADDRNQLSALTQAMEHDGRIQDLLDALRDPGRIDGLLQEYGICSVDPA